MLRALAGRACTLGVRRARARHISVSAQAAWSPGSPPPKAAALVIGNEVLSGKIQDTNTVWLGTRRVRVKGVVLRASL